MDFALNLYSKSPIEVIEYMWEEGLLSPNDLDNQRLLSCILAKATKDRLLWLYRNREMPKITSAYHI